MTRDKPIQFDPNEFLAIMDGGRTVAKYARNQIVYAQGAFTRPFIMAPDVPKERVEAMRKAFLQALADPELLADAKKQSLIVTPLPGPDLQAMIHKIYTTPPEIVAKVRRAIADP